MLEVADLLRDPFIINTIVLSVLFIFTLVGYFFSQRKVNNVRCAISRFTYNFLLLKIFCI